MKPLNCNKCKKGTLYTPKNKIGWVVCTNPDCDNEIVIESGGL